MDKLYSYLNQRVNPKQLIISSECLTYDSQLSLVRHITKTILKINPYYAKIILREYIKHIENSSEEISDELYELFCSSLILNAVESPPDTPEIIKYYVNGLASKEYLGKDYESILVKETPKVITGSNTTGLRTWEAALYLSNFLNDGPEPPYDFRDSNVLELGCGTGLTSLALAKNYQHNYGSIRQIVMTDGSTSVFDNLYETLKLNNLQNEANIRCQQLIWGDDLNIQEDIDFLIGADITFDSTLLETLCFTINDFFVNKNTKFAIIAATVRSIETIKIWEEQLEKWFTSKWSIKSKIEKPESLTTNCWFRIGTQEIRVYEIHS